MKTRRQQTQQDAQRARQRLKRKRYPSGDAKGSRRRKFTISHQMLAAWRRAQERKGWRR